MDCLRISFAQRLTLCSFFLPVIVCFSFHISSSNGSAGFSLRDDPAAHRLSVSIIYVNPLNAWMGHRKQCDLWVTLLSPILCHYPHVYLSHEYHFKSLWLSQNDTFSLCGPLLTLPYICWSTVDSSLPFEVQVDLCCGINCNCWLQTVFTGVQQFEM